MNKFVILLVCLATCASAGVLDNRGGHHGIWDDSNVDVLGHEHIVHMTKDDLLRQKFLLDILQHVGQPLVNTELLQLADTLIVDPSKYIEKIDNEMLHMIELCRQQRVLGKNEIYTITNEDHVRQMIGLYQLLVQSRDWDTFMRNLAFARKNINGVLMVNALLLAVRDRDDTKMLILPGIHEILPDLYYDRELVQKAKNVDLGNLLQLTGDHDTMRPGLLDMIGSRKRNQQMMMMNRSNMLDRTQLWMPWREMRMEMAMHRTGGDNVATHVSVHSDNKIVLPVEHRTGGGIVGRMSLFTEDVGLKSFLHGLVNDLCLKEDELLTGDVDRGNVGLERNMGTLMERERLSGGIMDRGMGVGRKGRFMHDDDATVGRHLYHDRVMGVRRVVDNDDDDYDRDYKNVRSWNTLTGRREHMIDDDLYARRNNLPTTSIDSDRLLHVNRRRLNSKLDNQEHDRLLTLGNERDRFMHVVHGSAGTHDGRSIYDDDRTMGLGVRHNILDRDDRTGSYVGRWGSNNIVDDRLMHGRGKLWDQDYDRINTGINRNQRLDDTLPTTSINSDRLLFVNRRRHFGGNNLDNMNTMGTQNRWSTHGGDSSLWNQNRRPTQWLNKDDNDDDYRSGNKWSTTGQQRFMNTVHGGIRDGRDVLGDVDTMGHHTNRDPLLRRSSIDNDHLTMGEDHLRDDRGFYKNINNDHYGRYGNSDKWDSLGNRMMGVDRHLRYGDRVDVDDDDRDVMMMRLRHRSPRSIHIGEGINSGINTLQAQHERQTLNRLRGGEITLHNLQQIVARINMELISLGIDNNVGDSDSHADTLIQSQRMNNPRLIGSIDQRYALRMNDMRVGNQLNRNILEKVNRIEQILTTVLEQEIRRHIGSSSQQQLRVEDQSHINDIIGDVLIGKLPEISMLRIVRDILKETEEIHGGVPTLANVGVLIHDPVMMHLLRRIVKIIDVNRQRLGGYLPERDLLLNGVTINDIKVDKLRTYTDVSDSDLINVLDDPRVTLTRDHLGGSQQMKQMMLVARQERLNHKSFDINVDLTSDRNQRVVIRTMLGPKIDALGRERDIDEERNNFILLDATTVNLNVGHNVITRKSKDIMWTTRDTTPLTEIYKNVVMSLENGGGVTMQRIVGQNCRFPHRLLLPRGRREGLPMRLLVIVTPVDEIDHHLQQTLIGGNRVTDLMCGIGIGTMHLDRRPLGFPLDRKIDNVQQLMNLPNLLVKDVMIHHDDQMNMINF